jgi:uncharacterized integral membrane protein
MRLPFRAVTATRPVHRERVSRIYLAVVAAALLLMLLDTALVSHGGSSPAGVLLLLVTLPWTPLLFALFAALAGSSAQATAYGWQGWTLTLVAAVVSALVNAVLLGWAVRVRRRRAAVGRAHRNSAGARS